MEMPNQLEDWHGTQNDEYLTLCLERLNQKPVRWVAQIVSLI